MLSTRPGLLFFLALLFLVQLGCTYVPKGSSSVDDVTIEGNDKLSSDEITSRIATTPSAKFLFLFRGIVYDYSLFDRGVLQRDLERVQRLYRSRGYYEAKARAGLVQRKDAEHVEVIIEVEEGLPVLAKEPQISGLEPLAEGEANIVRTSVGRALSVGEPFTEEEFNGAQAVILRALTDRGYAYAKVAQHANVDLVKREATPLYVVTTGPKATFGPIKVEGLEELPESGVLRTVNIDAGEPYSTVTIDNARDALVALGTFSSVAIEPQLGDPPPANAVVPLVVRVKEQRLKSVLLGGGFQIDSIRTQVHLKGGWEHRNLFGGFRHFRVDLKPTLDLYPTRLPSFETPTAVLPGERFEATLRQPGLIEARTAGVFKQELNTYPLLLSSQIDPASPVLGYIEYKGTVGLERTIWKLFGTPSYNFQYNQPFAYQGILDPDLRGIIISYVAARAHLDLRDDRIRPHAGFYLQNDMQFAGLGGDARDFRIQPELRGYIPLGRHVTLATRASVGFLFPLNYGAAGLKNARGEGDEVERADLVRDIELVFLRGFFSGGPSSNRGYSLRGVGPHGSVPFLNPDIESRQLARSCSPANPSYDELRCGVPLGGMSLWEASIELRFPIIEPLGGAVFCDTGDVSAEQLDLRLSHPHLSCGVGLRYDTPVGPVRIDAAYRIPGAQIPADADPRLEGRQSDIFGAPIAIAFGLGEAF